MHVPCNQGPKLTWAVRQTLPLPLNFIHAHGPVTSTAGITLHGIEYLTASAQSHVGASTQKTGAAARFSPFSQYTALCSGLPGKKLPAGEV